MPKLRDSRSDVVDVAFEPELGRVDADDRQSGVLVLGGPRAHIRKGAEPVDAGVRPEVDEDDASAEGFRRQRVRS